MDLGNFLIKRVAKQIKSEFESVQTLVTLSPLPGFRPWLLHKLSTAVASLPGELTVIYMMRFASTHKTTCSTAQAADRRRQLTR